jgi:hypothetical protein
MVTYPVRVVGLGVGVIVTTIEPPADCTIDVEVAELAASSALV